MSKKRKRVNIGDMRGQTAERRARNEEHEASRENEERDETEKVPFNLSFDPDHKAKLKYRAERAGKSASQYIADELDLDAPI